MSRRSTESSSGGKGSGLTPMSSAPPRPPTAASAPGLSPPGPSAPGPSAPGPSAPGPSAPGPSAVAPPVASGPPAMRPRSNSMDGVYDGGRGIRTQGRLEVGGSVHRTSVSFAGTEAHRHLDDFAPDLKGSAEQRLSHRDAEVGTLSQMDTFARAQLPAMTPGQTASFELHGDHGPCDGCKQRVQSAAHEWSALLPPGTRMQVTSYYLHAPHDEARSSVGTTYGYHADTGQTGVSYGSSGTWLYQHPVARYVRPAPPPKTLASVAPSAPGPASSAVPPPLAPPRDDSAPRSASPPGPALSSPSAPPPKPAWGSGSLNEQALTRMASQPATGGGAKGTKGGPGGSTKP